MVVLLKYQWTRDLAVQKMAKDGASDCVSLEIHSGCMNRISVEVCTNHLLFVINKMLPQSVIHTFSFGSLAIVDYRDKYKKQTRNVIGTKL